MHEHEAMNKYAGLGISQDIRENSETGIEIRRDSKFYLPQKQLSEYCA